MSSSSSKAAAAAAALERAETRLKAHTERMDRLQQQHTAGFHTLRALLTEEGLFEGPLSAIRSGPCTLAASNVADESDARADEIMNLAIDIEQADLAVRAKAASLRQV